MGVHLSCVCRPAVWQSLFLRGGGRGQLQDSRATAGSSWHLPLAATLPCASPTHTDLVPRAALPLALVHISAILHGPVSERLTTVPSTSDTFRVWGIDGLLGTLTPALGFCHLSAHRGVPILAHSSSQGDRTGDAHSGLEGCCAALRP